MRADIESRAAAVVTALGGQGLMLATVESCTGGLVAGAVTDIAGSSKVLDRGFVTYSNAAKTEMVGVLPALIEAHGAVSPQVAEAMARGALAHSGADIAVAITGIAGPGGSEFKPEGLVCFHVAARSGASVGIVREFGAPGRATVRALSIIQALELVLLVAQRD